MRRALPLLFVLSACPVDDLAPDPIHLGGLADGCEFLGSVHCLLPWPTDRWLAPDASRETGFHLAYESAAVPPSDRSEAFPFDPTPYTRFDGYSGASQILTSFGTAAVDMAGLPGFEDYERSLAADSPTVLLDLETGERVPHFVEVDARAHEEPDDAGLPTLLYLRPAYRLESAHRYAVAYRDLVLVDGTVPVATAGFAALRDGVVTDHGGVEARRASYDAMFAALETAGVPRAELQQAFWFKTASNTSTQGTLLSMRDDALTRVPVGGGDCSVEELVPNPGEGLAFRLDGTFKSPRYVDGERAPARVVRDGAGAPQFQDWQDIEFSLVAPQSAFEEGADPARLFAYGHGLMGSGAGGDGEINAGFVDRMVRRFHRVAIATDWQGMAQEDILAVGNALSDMNGFDAVPERMMQGMINQIVMIRSFLGACRELPELQHEGHSIVGGEAADFIGISQGGINGGTLISLSPDVERAALLVGAMNYAVMIPRSTNWPSYEAIFGSWYARRIDREILLALIGSLWEQAEPAGWLHRTLRDPVPGAEGHRVLYQVARYDDQVPNMASNIAVRTLGLPILTPSPVEPWGVETTAGPAESALVYYDVGAPPVSTSNIPADPPNDAHGQQRGIDAAQRQIDAFLREDGMIQNFCDGDCGPDETSAP